MTGRAVFEKIADVSDKFLEEAAFVPETGMVLSPKRRERGMSGFSRFMNSGWGLAVVCCLVAIGTIVGMVMWGRMGGPISEYLPAGTVDGTTDSVCNESETNDGISPDLTTNPRFDFSYHYEDDATSMAVTPGSYFTAWAAIVNLGKAFTYTGSSSDFAADMMFVYTDGVDYRIQGIQWKNADEGTFTVETGRYDLASYLVTIPNDAPEGTYDLILSYGGESQRFVGALTVTNSAVTDATTIGLSEKAILNQAKKVIMRRTGMTDLSAYQVSVTCDENGDWSVEYRVYIQGFPTIDVIYVKLAPDGKEIYYHKNLDYISEFPLYIPHVTQEMTDEAIAKLGDIDESKLYWVIDRQGYLCIGYEVVQDGGDCVVIGMVSEQVCPKPE